MALFSDDFHEGLGVAGDVVGIASGIAGLFGNKKGDGGAGLMREQMELAKNFAQNGIQWKVADAKAAGIHPLYALGAQPSSFSPASFIDGGGSDDLDHFSRAGQDLSRALKASASSGTRYESQVQALTLKRLELENDLLGAQIAKERGQIGPPMPMPGERRLLPGQGDSPLLGLSVKPADSHVQQKAMELTVPNPANTSQEPHAVSDLGFTWTGTGYAPVPSKDAKERLEDMGIPQMSWAWRNSILPNFGAGNPPPAHLIPEGYNNWRWSYSKQEWQPHYNPHKARVPVRRRGHHGPDIP